VERFRCAGQGRGIQKPERKRKGEARLGRCDLLEGVSCVARSRGKMLGQYPGAGSRSACVRQDVEPA
jgi:hypothetical protein